jgi:VanZ family protein
MKKYIGILIFAVSQIFLFTAALSNVQSQHFVSGSFAHVIAFYVTTILLVFSLRSMHVRFEYMLSFFYAFFCAWLIEFIQYTLPYRSFSISDALIGIVGSVAALITVKIFSSQKSTKTAKSR